jgi:hypothetical protein
MYERQSKRVLGLPVPNSFPGAINPTGNKRAHRAMDSPSQQRPNSAMQRQLANLKLISRLLGHELHSQSSAKVINFSRESVSEIQTTLDLFIEEASRNQMGLNAGTATSQSTRMVGTQN